MEISRYRPEAEEGSLVQPEVDNSSLAQPEAENDILAQLAPLKQLSSRNASESAFKLLSPDYRKNVRRVLESMGEPDTEAAYLKYEEIGLDWAKMAAELDRPTRPAICNILDNRGLVVKKNGRPVEVLMDVPVRYEDAPNRWLQWRGRSKLFKRWWME